MFIKCFLLLGNRGGTTWNYKMAYYWHPKKWRVQHIKNIFKVLSNRYSTMMPKLTSSVINNTILIDCREDCWLPLPSVHSLLPGVTNLKLQLGTCLPHKDDVHQPLFQSGETSWSGINHGVWTGQAQLGRGRHGPPPFLPLLPAGWNERGEPGPWQTPDSHHQTTPHLLTFTLQRKTPT